MPAIEASRREGAPAGWTFSKHQGTLVLKELSNWYKERKLCFRYGARNICSTRPSCQRVSTLRGSGLAPVTLGAWKDLGLSVAQLASGSNVM